jgi:HEPN domain-containing protein
MKESVKYWLDVAEYDLDVANAMLQTGKYLYVAFMCKKTKEKALKAVIARNCEEGEIPPRIHHLLKLADRAGLYSKMLPEQLSFIKDLNPMNIEARYPEYRAQIASNLTSDICAEIIAGTEELLCWIKKQL